MAERPARPLSPHLTMWGPHMLVSILHRVTGGALTVAGLAVLTWWLLALADGTDAYADFSSVAGHWAGIVVLISKRYHEKAPGDDRLQIEPDVPVEATWADVIAGRDVVLEAALAALDREASP